MTTRSPFYQLALEANEGQSNVRDVVPTLDERVSLYLRAVHGNREFTDQERSNARDVLLNSMATEIAVQGQPKVTARANVRAQFEGAQTTISRRGSVRPQRDSGKPTLASSVIGWIKALQERLFFSSEGTWAPGNLRIATASLLVVALSAGAALLIVKEFSGNEPKQEPVSSVPSSRLPLSPQDQGSDLARGTGRGTTYIIEVAEGRSAEEARANYQARQVSLPSILQGRDPLIVSSEGAGDSGDRRYLAAVGPFATLEQARGLCDELKASGAQCVMREYAR